MAELVLALDLPTRAESLRLLDRLPALRWVKVGPILMTAEGPALVRELVGRGLQVFLDLKWHDIPNTVAGAVSVAVPLGVRMATVHSVGGEEMLRAAATAAGNSLLLVGVTVLTSQRALQPTDAAEPGGGALPGEVERRARLVMEAGLSGVVCSPLEVERLRAVLGPRALIVVPGVRRPGDPLGDQQRTAGPAETARAGATHLVVGRPILAAQDPAAALGAFLEAMA